MKRKILTVAVIILFALTFAAGVYIAVRSAVALIAIIRSENGFADSFWTVELAVCAIVISILCAAASVMGIVSCVLKKKFMYVSFAVLLLSVAVTCIWNLSFYVGITNIQADDIVVIAVFSVIAAAAAAEIVACAVKLFKKKK